MNNAGDDGNPQPHDFTMNGNGMSIAQSSYMKK